ncbi:uncharacterized protein Dvar_11430 [Desulfosarcina variabilis str. Montpellier]|uniref:hypothetical protein n=1 Tax=Desulfosarcina variabilis TaxID=2300 RepID=UPI003AFA6915
MKKAVISVGMDMAEWILDGVTSTITFYNHQFPKANPVKGGELVIFGSIGDTDGELFHGKCKSVTRLVITESGIFVNNKPVSKKKKSEIVKDCGFDEYYDLLKYFQVTLLKPMDAVLVTW